MLVGCGRGYQYRQSNDPHEAELSEAVFNQSGRGGIMTKQNELNYVRIPCGMRIGTMKVPKPSRWQGMKNRTKKIFKRVLEF